MNSLERWTGMDWNGDGVVGGVGTLPAQKAFDWQAYERLHGVDLDGDGQIGGRAMTQDDLQGVGIVLQPGYQGETFISEIAPNGPAAVEGTLRVGDRIMSVDGVDTEREDMNEVVKLIRGRKGTFMEIVAKRGNMQMLVRLRRGISEHPQKLYLLHGEKYQEAELPYQPNYTNPLTDARGQPKPYALPKSNNPFAEDGRMPSQHMQMPGQHMPGQHMRPPPQQQQPPPQQWMPRPQPTPTSARWGPPIRGSVPPPGTEVSYVWDNPRAARNISGQPFYGASVPPVGQSQYYAH